MKEITKAYQCEFCGRVFTTVAGARKHEEACRKNPKNMSLCAWCPHLKRTETEVPVYDYYGDIEGSYKVTVLHCEKKNINLYHPKVLRMINWSKRDSIMKDAVMMPTKADTQGCDYYDNVLEPIDFLG